MTLPNLAIYSTYCGPTNNTTFCRRAHTVYPSYFVSNNQEVLAIAASNGWNPIYNPAQPITANPIESALQSKVAKTLPHMFEELNKYDYLFYIDDKYTISEGLVSDLVLDLNNRNAAIAMKQHRFLSPNVLIEFAESLKQDRYYLQREQMAAFIAARAAQGDSLTSPAHYETGCILRNMRHPDITDIDNMWFKYIMECGIECQISFFFVLKKYPNIMTLPSNIFS